MILVVGSTGQVGASAVHKLSARGKTVVDVVRDAGAEKARALLAAGARLVVGDLKAPPSLERVLKGVNAIICTASSTLSRREGDSLETVDGKGVQSLIDMAERKGVGRFIYVSFSRNMPSDFPLAEYKRAAERRLEASKLDHSILLPTCFM